MMVAVLRDPPHLIARRRVDLHQRPPVQFMLGLRMISFTYRCPRTGQQVHGHFADDLISETYEPVTCTACGSTHLVNPKTGRLLEEAKTAIR
jgi:DNA-directed RNA polymerase subunit RPC12/RpoP